VTLSLVTGGAGFVGRHLVSTLRNNGEKVRVLDLAPSEGEDDVQGSVEDPACARIAVEGADCVFHLAGDAQLWARDKNRFRRINLEGTRTMLAAARAARVKRFVHCSSLTTLVGRKTPIGDSRADESVRFEPADMLGPYPRSKLLAERAVEAAAREGLDAVICIPTEPLGPGDVNLTPPTRMIFDFVAGRTQAYIDCTLNFVPVDSLAQGFIAARDRGRRGDRYILGGENVSMRRLLDALQSAVGRSMPKTKLPYAAALLASVVDTWFVAHITGRAPRAPLTGVRLAGRRVSFSSEKAARELGWRAGPFESALAAGLAWFSEAGLT
jgi:dihydroflavonol-4-reductase